eukprot:TRINITY_DN4046_c1_g1_i1.p1 TRINITY_DN4046_c1_g1~~TRINITY_DN4046_c1_g1_i1.p1  ORF type:complete len:162 (-),score=32.61 TRINITY_DN4046_c1_g1_i1:99-584(-)
MTTTDTMNDEALFWLGPKGARTGIHMDYDPFSFLHQFIGLKRITLIPITETNKIYKSPKYDFLADLSLVDPWNYDKDKYPLYEKAKKLSVVLKPGDTLFVPTGWWHYAESLSTSLSISSRGYSRCEWMGFYKYRVLDALHKMGLYISQKECTCHNVKESTY